MREKVEPLDDDKSGENGKRQRSAIGFPYTDYSNVHAIAAAIHDKAGYGTCSAGQVAAWTDQSSKSSGFRTQLAAARLFGVIEGSDAESLRLSDLGRRVVDPAQARAAKAEAFLRVPLFKALYERYKDGVSPPNAALEREIGALGVAEKQKARARQVFESSAQQTGFRETAPNKLVAPAVVIKHAPAEREKNKNGGNGGDTGLHLDPLLMALLRKIPNGEEGWPAESRLRWFRTFAMNVSQVYDDNEPVELKIDLGKAGGG
jgi:hypothetical protein